MKFLTSILLLCVLYTSMVAGSSLSIRQRLSRAKLQQQTPQIKSSPFDSFPHQSLADFAEAGQLIGDDPLSQVRSVIAESNENSSFVEVSTELSSGMGVSKVRSFCEICILVMQMKERGQPHLCAGLNANYHVTCIEVLESLLRADKALVYWLKNGCMHMDSEGPEIVRPCPAINICSWVPNLFAEAPSLTRDGVESLCPKDPKFLPTIPQEFRNLLGNDAAPTPGGDAGPAAETVTPAAY